MNREARLEAIKKIEDALAKLKAEPEIQRPQGGFQNMSQEERTKLFTQFREARQAQQKSLDAIVAQVAALEGRRAPEREGAKFVIVNTADLKPIQESAVKEKATETTQLLDRLIARASGERGAFGGQRGQRGQGGQRPQRQRQQQQ
jgi:DNA integrity scanning protein DisA with diadenylate cyclase activity